MATAMHMPMDSAMVITATAMTTTTTTTTAMMLMATTTINDATISQRPPEL